MLYDSPEWSKNPAIEFRLAGKTLQLSRDEVITKLRGVTPESVRKHAVLIGDVEYPIKQAFAVATGTDLLDANTYQARSVLQRLGFEVRRLA
jgi:hypothetical protein